MKEEREKQRQRQGKREGEAERKREDAERWKKESKRTLGTNVSLNYD